MLRLLPIIAIVVVVVLNTRTIIRSESPPYCLSNRTTSTCPGDLVEIRYPFWIENRTTDEDGDCTSYEGFQIKCAANGRPIVNISNNSYYVLSTDSYGYGGARILRVVGMDIDAQECPKPRRNISIDSARFPESLPYCGYSYNKTSTCPGDLVEIRYPFWIENRTTDEDGDCKNYYPGFQVKCAANGRPVINISNHPYYVLSTERYEYEGGGSLRVVDVDIDAQECPQPRRNISIEESTRFLDSSSGTFTMTFFYNCSGYPSKVVQHVPCLYNGTRGPSFALFDYEISTHEFDWYGNCEEAVVLSQLGLDYYPISEDYTEALKNGSYLYWRYPVNCGNCELSGGKCWANEGPVTTTNPFYCICPHGTYEVDDACPGSYSESFYGIDIKGGLSIGYKIATGVSMGVGGLLLSILVLLYRRKCDPLCKSIVSKCRKKIKGPTNVEIFLDNEDGGLSAQSYKYSDIKKMTDSFRETLGQGGYGSVFKGKLRSGRLVAVKMLNESKGKGEDFINEVATIGRTNHVNVVSLLGFCAEGSKRALVYEFMPNGSLEKFIHNAKDSITTGSSLGWEKLYQIALGIARGLEYLHRGCNTRILHFDIKPHNILLDQDFCPKISDFGLAKLCPTRESLVSMVGARGTPGYIAPEVYCGNFGGVSHKSDVYSYGMMVLEMIGGRKNMDIYVENASQIYFPQWIYKRLKGNIKGEGSEKIEPAVISGEVFEEETVQKMIIVALWCIQAHPGDRPSMTKVVETLEGNTEDLKFPPNPFPDPSSTYSLP